MQITDVPGSGGGQVVDADKVGFAGLTADSFMRLLITQLQHQDPMNPVDNDELLSQIAMMRNLQSNIELGEALKSITTNQQLSTAATFIGRSVTGTTLSQQQVSGVADRAFLRDGRAFLGIGQSEVPLSQVTDIAT